MNGCFWLITKREATFLITMFDDNVCYLRIVPNMYAHFFNKC